MMEAKIGDQVLVTYTTKYGGTAEIAGRIGHVLREAGLPVEVLPVDRVRDLAPYTAIVLGSAVYMGRWRKEAARFLRSNERSLAGKPVWIFSSGPTNKGDAVELLKGWTFPEALRPIVERIQPQDVAVFHGVLDRQKLNLFDKWVIDRVKAPLGDFRDWETIVSWASAIADNLTAASSE